MTGILKTIFCPYTGITICVYIGFLFAQLRLIHFKVSYLLPEPAWMLLPRPASNQFRENSETPREGTSEGPLLTISSDRHCELGEDWGELLKVVQLANYHSQDWNTFLTWARKEKKNDSWNFNSSFKIRFHFLKPLQIALFLAWNQL